MINKQISRIMHENGGLSAFYGLCFFVIFAFSGLVLADVGSSTVVKTGSAVERKTDVTEKNKQSVIWQDSLSGDQSHDLKQRMTQYWSHFVRRAWDKNFAMETPSNRKLILLSDYQAYFTGGWLVDHVEIQKLKHDAKGNNLVATVIVYFDNKATKTLQRLSVQDRWQKVDDKWYHNFHDPLINLRARK